MRTAVITIGSLEAGKGYGLSVAMVKEGATTLEAPLETFVLDEDLGLNPQEVRQYLMDESDPSEKFEVHGEALYKLLIDNSVGAAWLAQRDALAGDGLRTILDIQDVTLRALPWELLCGPNGELFTSKDFPMARGCLGPKSAHVGDWPIRVLVVIGSLPSEKDIGAEEEVVEIQLALKECGRMIELVVLRNPNSEDLFRDYKTFRPHVFHFIGHGDHDGAGKPYLYVGLDEHHGWDWTAQKIRPFLNEWVPRVVCLNACRSSSGDEPAEIAALTQVFSRAGVAATLGMQADIRGDAAARFGGPLYRALAFAQPLDRALAEARIAVATKLGLNRRDWCLPQLHFSTLPEKVLTMRTSISEERFQRIKKIPEFAKTKSFVDRCDLRRELCDAVRPIGNESNYKDFVVIHGDSKVGKSDLLYYCLETCMLRGWTLACVDMADGRSRNYLDVLRLIRDGDETNGSLLFKSPFKDSPAFNRFNHELNHWDLVISAGQRPPLHPDDQGLVIEKKPKRPLPPELQQPTLAAYFCGLFCKALQEAAGEQPLVVALDQLNIDMGQFENLLAKYLFAPMAQHQFPPVRFILAADDTYYAALHEVKPRQVIKVPLFRNEDYKSFAEEYCRFFKYPLDRFLVDIIKNQAERFDGDWKPLEFTDLKRFAKL